MFRLTLGIADACKKLVAGPALDSQKAAKNSQKAANQITVSYPAQQMASIAKSGHNYGPKSALVNRHKPAKRMAIW